MHQKDPEAEAIHETEEQLLARLNLEVADFFEADSLEPEIVTYKSKEDLHRVRAETSNQKITEVPDWVVAFASYGKVHILSSNVMPPWNATIDGPTRYRMVLKHEIAHLYTNRMNGSIPFWLNDGVSLFVAGQDQYKRMQPDELSIELLDELDHPPADERICPVGINMVNQIMAHFGKEKLFEIMAFKDKNERYAELRRMFPWLE